MARVEGRTFICAPTKEQAGPTNNWMDPDEAYKMLYDIARGSYKGRTMYVIPYSMGPVGSPFAKYGIELTDSIYVVLNMAIMTRVGKDVLEALGDSDDWVRGLHCKCDIVEEKRYICHFPHGVGEMGIGNTTTSSAVLAVLLDAPVETVTGRGGGVTDEAFARKKAVIQKAIAINAPDRNDALDVLAKVGGFDLAAMCGAFLGAAATRRPVVIDGLISAVAALCACRICPDVRAYLVPSHASYEIGYRLAMDEMGLEPMLLLGMRLGEGSGCPLAFEVLDAACAIINDMATFDEAGIDDGYLDEIREGDKFTVEGAQ